MTYSRTESNSIKKKISITKLAIFDLGKNNRINGIATKLFVFVALLVHLMFLFGTDDIVLIVYSIQTGVYISIFNSVVTSRLVSNTIKSDITLGVKVKDLYLSVLFVSTVVGLYNAIFIGVMLGYSEFLSSVVLYLVTVISSLISFLRIAKNSKSKKEFLMFKLIVLIPLVIWFKFDSIPALEGYGFMNVMHLVGYYQNILIVVLVAVWFYKQNKGDIDNGTGGKR